MPFDHSILYPDKAELTKAYQTHSVNAVGYNENQGTRENMEDRVCLNLLKSGLFLSVFDGHGGDAASQYLQNHFGKLFDALYKSMVANSTKDEYHELIVKCFQTTAHVTDAILLSYAAKIIRKKGSEKKCLLRTSKKQRMKTII